LLSEYAQFIPLSPLLPLLSSTESSVSITNSPDLQFSSLVVQEEKELDMCCLFAFSLFLKAHLKDTSNLISLSCQTSGAGPLIFQESIIIFKNY